MKIIFIQPKLVEYEEDYVAYKLGEVVLINFRAPEAKVKDEPKEAQLK
jgi:hypothetical protein